MISYEAYNDVIPDSIFPAVSYHRVFCIENPSTHEESPPEGQFRGQE